MRTKQILFKNDFQNEATLVMENEKANTWQARLSRHRWSRGKLVTATTVDVRVFFFHFFGEKCSNMKNEKMGKKAQQTNKFQKRFSKRGHSRNGK